MLQVSRKAPDSRGGGLTADTLALSRSCPPAVSKSFSRARQKATPLWPRYIDLGPCRLWDLEAKPSARAVRSLDQRNARSGLSGHRSGHYPARP